MRCEGVYNPISLGMSYGLLDPSGPLTIASSLAGTRKLSSCEGSSFKQVLIMGIFWERTRGLSPFPFLLQSPHKAQGQLDPTMIEVNLQHHTVIPLNRPTSSLVLQRKIALKPSKASHRRMDTVPVHVALPPPQTIRRLVIAIGEQLFMAASKTAKAKLPARIQLW